MSRHCECDTTRASGHFSQTRTKDAQHTREAARVAGLKIERAASEERGMGIGVASRHVESPVFGKYPIPFFARTQMYCSGMKYQERGEGEAGRRAAAIH